MGPFEDGEGEEYPLQWALQRLLCIARCQGQCGLRSPHLQQGDSKTKVSSQDQPPDPQPRGKG